MNTKKLIKHLQEILALLKSYDLDDRNVAVELLTNTIEELKKIKKAI